MVSLFKRQNKAAKSEKQTKKAGKSKDLDSSVRTGSSSSMEGPEDPSTCSYASSNTKTSKSSSKKTTSKLTKNEKRVLKLVKVLNGDANAEEYVTHFTENAVFAPEDTPPMPVATVAAITASLKKSFPDFQFDYKSIKEVKPGQVVVEESQFHGHHTGEPYSLMPRKLPAMEATGKFVKVDPERWFMDMSPDGKIERFNVIALGSVTGPAGVYEVVGGKLG